MASTTPNPPRLTGFPDGQFLQRQAGGARWQGPIQLLVPAGSPAAVPAIRLLGPDSRPLPGAVASLVPAPPASGTPAPAGGTWQLELAGIPAGGPHTLELTLDQGCLRREFWAGDLWLMAGQSNMEGVGAMEDAAPPHPWIRNFTMARVWTEARDPLHFLAESPDPVHRQGANDLEPDAAASAKARAVKGCGVGIPFARQMLELTGVPQGLVSCAHGGTTMGQWDPALAGQGGASLYGSLLLSLHAVNQPLAGVLWYQGCSDATDEAEPHYTRRMVDLVAALRRDTGQADLPWLTVQIGTEIGRTWQTAAWHRIQEQQRRLPELIPHLDVVAAADLEHDDWIHISGKAFPVLARRLVQLARRLVLCQGPDLPAPQVLAARWAPDHLGPAIVLDCANIAGHLASVGKPLGFTLADQDFREQRLVYQVRYRDHQVLIRLTGDDLTGLAVFHGLDTEAQINTYDSRGLPLPVFGPLAIQGLPPLSGWFRSWQVSPALTGASLDGLDPADHSVGPGWKQRRFEGWNVINLKDEWQDVPQVRLCASWLELPQAMELELQAGGDGALRVWLADREVLTDLNEPADLGCTRTSQPLPLGPGRYRVLVAFGNRGGQSWGFYLRWKRLDCPAGATVLLPREGVPDEN